MSRAFENASVGEIAAANPEAARLFEQIGIDFCCGGRRSLREACRRAAVDPSLVLRELEALPATATDPSGSDVGRWPLEQLIEHIVSTHHAYIRERLPVIAAYLTTLQAVHADRHPELAQVRKAFDRLSEDLHWHLVKEEILLFPYIRDIVECASEACNSPLNPFGTVENPIRMLEREHQEAADDLLMIRELTDGFATPPDTCATYSACMAELQRFERDLHRHVHLENNVLFPRAIALERAGV